MEGQEIGIGKGAMVVDSQGEQLGVIDQLYYDEEGGQLRGVSVRAGGMLLTLFGGGETVEVPARFIDHIGESTVYLNATMADLRAEAADAMPT
jgi:sporulation protein YlmC with PRC-barrel domain